MGQIFPTIVRTQRSDGVLSAALKRGTKEFETCEGITLAFHRIDTGKFGEIVDESYKIFVSLSRVNLVGCNIRVYKLSRRRRPMRFTGFESFSGKLTLDAGGTLLYGNLVHGVRSDVVKLRKAFEGSKAGSDGR